MGMLLNLLCGGLTVLFIVAGLTKLSPSFHPASYRFQQDNFRHLITPFWEKIVNDNLNMNIQFDASLFLQIVGSTEIAAAVLLCFNRSLKRLAGGVLSMVMVGAIATHLGLHEDPTFPVIVLVLCITVQFLALSTK